MAEPQELHTVAQELYGLRPQEFVEARAAAEAAARSAGDRQLAKAVKALRRPAVAAWAVNLLVRERGELLEQVVALGESLRQAQSLLQGDALRDLAKQRRQLVAAVTTEARELARGEGQRLSDAAVRQVEDTLQAAMTDRGAADAVLSGLLAQPLASTGLDSLAEVLAVPLTRARALDAGADDGDRADADAESSAGGGRRARLSVVRDDDRVRREAQKRVAAAGAAVRSASQTHDEAVHEQGDARARVLQLEAELEELRRRVAEVEQQTDEAAEQLTEADAAVDAAAAELADARAEADRAAAALESLAARASRAPRAGTAD